MHACISVALAIPAAPTNLIAVPKDTFVNLTWNPVAGATVYKLYRRTNPANSWSFVSDNNNNTAVDNGLSNGTLYYYVVRAKDGTGTSGDSNIASATPIPKPIAPLNLTSAVSSTRVDLNWDIVATATGYTVKRAANTSGPYSVVGTSATNSAFDTGRPNGVTYYYKVFATNGSGDGPDSLPVSATPLLTAPTNLTAAASNSQVVLNWTAVNGVTNYTVYRSTIDGGSYALLANKTGTGHTDSTAVNNTTYYYVVIATDSSGESRNSNQATATPRANPSAPTGLAVTAGNGQVSLTWNPVIYATSYNVKRKPNGGTFSPIGTSATASYVDSTPTNGFLYTYKVSAVNVGGESTDSTTVDATPRVTAPANLTVTPGNTQITLSWNAVAGASSYKVKRGTVSGTYPTVNTVSNTTTSYSWTGLTNGVPSYFVVVATDNAGESPASNEASATPIALPAIPTGLVGTAGNAQVSLTWNAVPGATGYTLRRKPSGGTYATIATPAGNSYLDTTGLSNGTQYIYSVASVNGGGIGGYSTEIGPTPKLTPPINFMAIAGSAQVTVTWNAVLNASGYKVKRGIATGNYPTVVVLNGNGTTSYTWTGLTNGTPYYFVVEAAAPIAVGGSNHSVEAIATPQLAAPTGLVATPGNTQVTLNWTAVGGAASYQVWRAASSGGTYTSVGTPASNSFINTALSNGTPYYYVVKSVSGATISAPSNQVSATPIALPAIPTGFVGTAGNAQVSLIWNAVPGATSYTLRRKPNNGTYAPIATPSGNSYLDTTGLNNGTQYIYSVAAVNPTGVSSYSTEIGPTPKLTPPVNFAATAISTQITVIWNAVPNANGYIVKRGTATGNYSSTQTVTGTSYTWTGLNNGTLYYLAVQATAPNSSGNSDNSVEVTATPTLAPASPTGLTASGFSQQVSLAWNAVAGANSYNIKRGIATGGPYSPIQSNVLTNNYYDLTAVNGTPYYYVVSAVGNGGESSNSNQASATPLPPAPIGPSAPVFSDATGTTVVVTAPALPQDAQSLTLQYKLASQSAAAYEDIYLNLSGANVSTVYGLDPGAQYYFRYVAYGLGGSTPGTAATLLMPNRTISWGFGSAINCAGIYFPGTGGTLAQNAIGRLSAFLATDWDLRSVTLEGAPVASAFSDTCSYVWSVSDINGNGVGFFESELTDNLGRKYGSGQSVRWAAPPASGTYTITLIVDDQNDGNKGNGDSNSRNDQFYDGIGFNDPALIFTRTITVP